MFTSIVASVLALIVTLAQGAHTIQVVAGPVTIEGDPITRLVATPHGDDRMLVAGESGLYLQAGETWESVAPAPPPGRVVSAGADSDVLLAGDHEACLRGGSSLPLQRSSDGGQTWEAVEGAAGFRPLAIWPERNLALASSCLGLHVSLDGGLTWNPVEGIEPGWEVTSFAVAPRADDSGPVVLVGLTGEGGTSYLRSIDFTDAMAPVVSSDLRIYYAIGGLAGEDDTYVLAAMDGVWISNDAGMTWERSAEGLKDVVLDQDPAEFGFPADIDPSAYGLFAVALLPGERAGIVAGSVDGLYISYDDSPGWSRIEGASGRVNEIAVNSEGTLLLYATDEGVFRIDIGTTA